MPAHLCTCTSHARHQAHALIQSATTAGYLCVLSAKCASSGKRRHATPHLGDAAPRHACFRISFSNLAVQTQEPAEQKSRARHEEGLNEGLRSTTRPLQSCSALCRSLAFSIRTWPDSQWLRQAQLSLARGIAQCKLKAARVCAASLACLSGVYQPTSGSNAALQCHCSASCNVEHTIVQRA